MVTGGNLFDRGWGDEFELTVATMSPTPRQSRLALAIAAAIFVASALVLPFAATQLPRIDSFIPAIQALIFFTDLTTAALLFGQYSVLGRRALLVLASGYLFSALIVIPHTLAFPGAIVSAGLLGGGLQSSPWLYTFWHFGFVIAVAIYVFMKDEDRSKGPIFSSVGRTVCGSVAIVIGIVCALTWLVIGGEKVMPRLVSNEISFTPLAHYVTLVNLLLCLFVLALLYARRRSVLDLWLIIAMCALVAELTLVSVIVPGRFTLGYYVSRVLSVIVSTIVLVVLLVGTIRLYAVISHVNRVLRRERENKLMNMEAGFSAIAHEMRQPLTGITANGAAAKRFLERIPPDIGRVQCLLDDMIRSSFRASELFESIRLLFTDMDQEQQLVDISALITGALQLVQGELLSHHVVIRTHLASDLPTVVGHRVQLQEVIIHLVQNAIDALANVPDRERILHIGTKQHEGAAITIMVQDSGPGIDPQRFEKIFDPFVTTKAKRMGLGLAICKTIVEKHDGRLVVSSDGRTGATFEVILPVNSAKRPLSAFSQGEFATAV
jgi:signal transduction histidine kinase